jgi:hypothetical protein
MERISVTTAISASTGLRLLIFHLPQRILSWNESELWKSAYNLALVAAKAAFNDQLGKQAP